MAIIESTHRDRLVLPFLPARTPLPKIAGLRAIWAEWQIRRRYRHDPSGPGRVSFGTACAILAMLAVAFAQPAYAGEKNEPRKPISEAEVQIVSDATYTELLRQALNKGWRFAPEQIEKGYRRHFEELKLRLIDQGYTILAGEVGV